MVTKDIIYYIIQREHRENNTKHSSVFYVINKQKYNYSFARHLHYILNKVTCSIIFV